MNSWSMYKVLLRRFTTKNENFTMRKINLLPLGVLYAKSDVVGKVKFIFDIFSVENKLSKKSENFQTYILGSFFLSSYVIVYCGKDISKRKINLKKEFEDEDNLKELIDIYNPTSCATLLDEFNESFFEKDSLDWEDFGAKFERKNGFQWILSPKGIRSKLNEIQKKTKI